MKNAVLATLAVLAVAVPVPARAEGPTAVVHIDASSQVVLERVDSAGDAALACSAPCDAALAIDQRYRINGAGVRPSSPFRLTDTDGARVVITPDLAHSRTFVAGVVLTSLATVFLGGALAGLAGGVASHESLGGVLPGVLGIVSGGISLSLGIPGTLMLANNVHSTVTLGSEPRAAMRAPSFTSIPILSGAF